MLVSLPQGEPAAERVRALGNLLPDLPATVHRPGSHSLCNGDRASLSKPLGRRTLLTTLPALRAGALAA